ncbi:beta-1,6-N-acetylglucosaminyltransferase [Massilia sp. Se16.2.3]|uniref:beta-1,6-N-acetylglucosaminyltransferase n=1 Tax=Massilia sp. Se16.2.3 TaxID=2709303 RepID=UPI001E308CCB|nr:beta-1,6-N-acetylglucosaminyltransferase [Massilia sp. Se16.2.3]
MRQVFLIHAHRDLEQLNTLIARLCDPDFVIYVHLDRKWQVDPAQVHPGARQVQPRVDVRWGGFSQVRAMLGSLRQVIASERDFDKLVFLSAQDYPVLPNAVLKHELAALRGRELIDTVAIGPGGWPAAYRYQFFHREGGALPARLGCAFASRALRLAGRDAAPAWRTGALWRLGLVDTVPTLPDPPARPGGPATAAGTLFQHGSLP